MYTIGNKGRLDILNELDNQERYDTHQSFSIMSCGIRILIGKRRATKCSLGKSIVTYFTVCLFGCTVEIPLNSNDIFGGKLLAMPLFIGASTRLVISQDVLCAEMRYRWCFIVQIICGSRETFNFHLLLCIVKYMNTKATLIGIFIDFAWSLLK